MIHIRHKWKVVSVKTYTQIRLIRFFSHTINPKQKITKIVRNCMVCHKKEIVNLKGHYEIEKG